MSCQAQRYAICVGVILKLGSELFRFINYTVEKFHSYSYTVVHSTHRNVWNVVGRRELKFVIGDTSPPPPPPPQAPWTRCFRLEARVIAINLLRYSTYIYNIILRNICVIRRTDARSRPLRFSCLSNNKLISERYLYTIGKSLADNRVLPTFCLALTKGLWRVLPSDYVLSSTN